MKPYHVTSLPLSLALREAGYKQEGSVFVHIKTKHARGIYYVTEAIRPLLAMPDTEWCAAPLASELMAELPEYVYLSRTHKSCIASFLTSDLDTIQEEAGTLPDALAKLWLHIHSQKII